VSEAIGANIEAFGQERGHRTSYIVATFVAGASR
jgi:hypothetical protein